jgi:hypothetical protein
MRSRAFVVLGILSTALVTGGWLLERGLGGGSTVSVIGPAIICSAGVRVELCGDR